VSLRNGALVHSPSYRPHHEGSRDPARTSLWIAHSGGVLVCETSPPKSFPAQQKFSGAAMAAIGQKGLPVIVWNIRLYAGITLRWLYLCKRKGR